MQRIRPTRRQFNYVLLTLVIISMILFIIEVSMPLSERSSQIIGYIHILVLLLFLVDLYLEYKKIGDLKIFLRRYWFEILIMIVFSSLGRIFRAFAAARNVSAVGEELGRSSRILIFARANFYIYRFRNTMRKTMAVAMIFSRIRKGQR